ncbi:MAG: hypothetical protein MK229_03265 [Nitrososphaerales archaeon]|jgi:RNA binding exosome subunit|nr:hypothetical protein [Nitrososphaerales archaeon]
MNISLTILKKTQKKLDFRTIEITFVIHETEDIDKFLSHLFEIFGLSDTDFSIKKTEGHHGNIIQLIRAHLIRDRVPEITNKILSSINVTDLKTINNNLLYYLDDKFTLYLRFNKQDIIDNILTLSYDDSVRIKMKPKIKLNKDKIIASYKELLSEYS